MSSSFGLPPRPKCVTELTGEEAWVIECGCGVARNMAQGEEKERALLYYPNHLLCVSWSLAVRTRTGDCGNVLGLFTRPGFLIWKGDIYKHSNLWSAHELILKASAHPVCYWRVLHENPVHIRTRCGKVWLADSLGEQAPWCHVSNQGFVTLMVFLCGGCSVRCSIFFHDGVCLPEQSLKLRKNYD